VMSWEEACELNPRLGAGTALMPDNPVR
jgi:hypothetical protein